MPSSKKDRKNAKDGGGVSSAVSKLAAGKANGTLSKGPASVSSSSGASPVIKPLPTPTAQDGAHHHHNNGTSPPLDTLSTTSVSASTAASPHHDWVRGGLAGSPGNLISLMGESPPTQPSSYEDHARFPNSWTNQGAFLSPQTVATPSPPNSTPGSVPNSYRRPMSYQQETRFSPETHAQNTTAAMRRMSVASHLTHARSGSNLPPPHRPQAHFYGAPGLDFGVASQNGMRPGDNGYHCGFDTLPSPHMASLPGSDNVVLTGYEGGLEVHSVTKRGVQRVAGLKGLRGGVIGAKILPWTGSSQDAGQYPLVAVVVHGPVLPRSSPAHAVQRAEEGASDDALNLPGSPRTDGSHKDSATGRTSPDIDSFQTTVELYSLNTNELIDVLLEAPKIPLAMPITSPVFKSPAATGALTIKADSGYIAVASGQTGEVWIYRLMEAAYADEKPRFGCAGKLWTSLQQPLRGERADEFERQSPAPSARPSPQTPIFAINGRWIAHCPPKASTQIALRADVKVPVIGKAPGLTSVTAPVLPTITSNLELPIPERMMNKIMRETTQELISGAKWVGQQGLSAWNAYWNKNAASQQPRSPPLNAQHWVSSYPPRGDTAQFPPTHGSPGQPVVNKDPGLISILDIGSIGQSAALHPVATFPSPLGCSFLSFSPSGLYLFTASNKGDVQTVWDLMCMQYTKSSPLQVSLSTNVPGPRVRQIAHFSRMTVARIVDVAWSRPNGERLAMVTERGTVHLFDMPDSAFTWPPPRRRQATEPNGGASVTETSSSAVSFASTAFGAAFEAAKPLINRPRGSSAHITGTNGANFVDSASQGGRAIAASIGHSLGKTGTALNQLRYTGETRVSLPSNTASPSASCVMWLTGRRNHSLFVVGDGLVRTFPSKTRRSSVQDRNSRQRGERHRDFKLPSLPDDTLAPAAKHFMDNDEYLDLSDREMEAENTLTLDPRSRAMQPDLSAEASIPHAEIESSAPYQPFHTDRRVSLYEYATADATATAAALGVPEISDFLADTELEEKTPPSKKKKGQQQQQQRLRMEAQATPAPAPTDYSRPWAFGQKLDLVKLDLGHVPLTDEDFNTSDDGRALPSSSIERVMRRGDNGDEIVVTTRRRRGARHEDDDDGFFEDDCEVLDFADQRV